MRLPDTGRHERARGLGSAIPQHSRRLPGGSAVASSTAEPTTQQTHGADRGGNGNGQPTASGSQAGPNLAGPQPSFAGGRQRADVRRSLALMRAFIRQLKDEAAYYRLLAEDTAALLARYCPIAGARLVDVGGGPGWFAQVYRELGAAAVFVERDAELLGSDSSAVRTGAIVGDGLALPFPDGAFDVVHSSNVIEHVGAPDAFFSELVRVAAPGATIFLAFTNWWSPFGGHETAPWHWLGGERAARRYERRHGAPPKNRYGRSLFPLHVSSVLRMVRAEPRVELVDALPRYHPSWARFVVRVPLLREIATWNLALVLRKRTTQ
jgi:SAM-dependent methyltransferase